MLYKLSPEIAMEADGQGGFQLELGDLSWSIPESVFMHHVAVFIAPTNLQDTLALAGEETRELLADMAELGGLVPVEMPRPADRAMAHGIAVNPNCAQLVVYFCGNLVLPGTTINILGTMDVYEIGERNFLFLRDDSCQQYRTGISDDVPSFPALLNWLRGVIDAMPWVEELHFIGVSSGGLAASMAAHYLKADTAICLGLVKTGDALGAELDDGVTWDLKELLQEHNGKTRYDLYYGVDHGRDRDAAEALADLPGVRLIGLPTDDHDVMSVLHKQGDLASLLPDWKRSDAEQPWNPEGQLHTGAQEGAPEAQAEGKAVVAGLTSSKQGSVETWAFGELVDTSAKPFHRSFEDRVASTPDRTAVRFEDGEWSYAELNEKSNRLAHRLRELGVSRETPVGVSVRRSAELAAALVGVLKSGGFYVALEPSLPAQRLRHIVSDSNTGIVVCDSAGREALTEASSDVTMIDLAETLSSGESSNLADVEVAGDDLAYLLYTSGTTGEPKGVTIPHHALANHSEVFATAICGLEVGDETSAERTFGLMASYTFDLFVSEFFPPLLAGASIAVVPPTFERQPDSLVQFIREKKVTDLWTTPTVLRLLSASREGLAESAVAFVYAAGEALTAEIVSEIREDWGATLWNLYGVTEMCAGQTAWRATELSSSDSPPIGGAVPNHMVTILDSLAGPSEVGAEGEIVIAGAGEARGYHGLARQTALSFIPAVVSRQAGQRAYCTGDVGYWNDQGSIEYRGRADHQIQVCGVRVELSEIEAHLETFPQVGRAIVLPVDETAGRADSLAAYLTATGAAEPTPHELRQFLTDLVAETVIPAKFVFVDKMPLSPSGKIDRNALQSVEADRKPFDGVAPRTPTEESISEIWIDLLGLERIGVHDNFFDLGGTSVLVAWARRRMDDELGVNVPDTLFFERGTIAEVAEYIDKMQTGRAG